MEMEQQRLPYSAGRQSSRRQLPDRRSRTTSVLPFVRPAWLVEDDEILALEVVAVVYDVDQESAHYLARVVGAVGSLTEFAAGDVTFSEGDALRIRTLRQRERLMEEQRRQCDDAREFIESL
jgi:hypothetical protein